MIILDRKLDFVGLDAHIGETVAVRVKRRIYIGVLKSIPARTRGNRTLGFTKSTCVNRNTGRVTKHGRTPLWVLIEEGGYDTMQGIFAFDGKVPQAREADAK